jgi:CxxH/CxxC protein (TIGR04129 family)
LVIIYQQGSRCSPVFLFPQVDNRRYGAEMYKCCEEHIELAIDMYIDEREAAPEIEKISVDKQALHCDFCKNQAIYIVGN